MGMVNDADHDQPELRDVSETPTAVMGAVLTADQLPAFFDRAFPAVAGAVAEQGVAIAGPALARYHGPPGDTFDLEVGFPTDGTVQPVGEVRPATLPAGRVARVVHHGGYDALPRTWDRLQEWMAGQGLAPGDDLWEVYLTEPKPDMDPAELRTELVWTVGG